MPTTVSPPDPRYHFLDWVRILAFFLLIAYHVGMFYVTWDWHVKSPYASTVLEPYMMLSSPWRLGLLFFVAGVASRCMLATTPAPAFIRKRARRLLLPLLFGMLVIVPPQPYLEVVEKLGYGGGYLDFMRLYLAGYHGFCQDGCLVLPTWNHLWFLPYLWVYSVVLALLMRALGADGFDALAQRLGRALVGWKLVVLPTAVLALARIALVGRFPNTHALVDDWYAHAHYLALFVLGALVARVPAFWVRVEAARWTALALAFAGWAAIVVWYGLPYATIVRSAWRLLIAPMSVVHALLAWSAILAASGFARRHLDHDGAARRYLTEAVFPVYILHQTLIVVLAHALGGLHRPPVLEACLLIVLTTVLCFAGFELVRRVPPLRPLFGLGPRRRNETVAPAPAVSAT